MASQNKRKHFTADLNKNGVILKEIMYLLIKLFLILTITRCSVISTATRSVFTNQLSIGEGRIIGGQAALPHSHPYIVSLQLRFLWVRVHFCGGSIINQNWVLTAGHCVTESWLIRWSDIDAIAGAHDADTLTPDVQINKIVQRLPHDNYMGGIGPNDIAMLKTETPFIFTDKVQPISLPPAYMKFNEGSLILLGWGVLRTTTFIPDTPTQLQELNVTYVPYDKCQEQLELFAEEFEENPLSREANLCTGPVKGGKAACNGDSGGPLILRRTVLASQVNEDSNEISHKDNVPSNSKRKDDTYLVGVVSWGVSPCGEKGAPTVYTDVTQYLDFIKSYKNT